MAAERGNGGVARLSDPLHPAVLRLIDRVARAARPHGCRVAVCGEAGSDPAAVPLLVGLGVDELSVAPRRVAAGQGVGARARLRRRRRAGRGARWRSRARPPSARSWPRRGARRVSRSRSSSPAAAASWAAPSSAGWSARPRGAGADPLGSRRPGRCRAAGREPVRGDILDPASLERAMAGCEVVYHVAGRQRLLPARPRRARPGERQGHPQRRARGRRRRACGGVVYTSSAATIGEEAGTVGTEGSPHRGRFLSHYERSKYEAERVRAWPRRPSAGVELVCVNPASVQGPGRTRGHGADPHRRAQRAAADGGRLAPVAGGRRRLRRGAPAGRGPRRAGRALPALGRDPHGGRGGGPARPHRRPRGAPAPPAAAGGDGDGAAGVEGVARAARPAPAGVPGDGAHDPPRPRTTTARGPPASWGSPTRPLEESLRRRVELVEASREGLLAASAPAKYDQAAITRPAVQLVVEELLEVALVAERDGNEVERRRSRRASSRPAPGPR